MIKKDDERKANGEKVPTEFLLRKIALQAIEIDLLREKLQAALAACSPVEYAKRGENDDG